MFLNTLGVAQYRAGRIREAVATLTRSDGLSGGKEPADVAFMAMAQLRLGRRDAALITLGRLRVLMRDPALAGAADNVMIGREAEETFLDASFPGHPFGEVRRGQ